MTWFLVIVAGCAVAIAVASFVNGVDYVGLMIATLLIVGVAVLYAARRARVPAVVPPRLNYRVGRARWLARLPHVSRFLVALATIAYGMGAIHLLRPRTPNPSARWGWLLSEVHSRLGDIGVPALYFVVGTVLLLLAWRRRGRDS